MILHCASICKFLFSYLYNYIKTLSAVLKKKSGHECLRFWNAENFLFFDTVSNHSLAGWSILIHGLASDFENDSSKIPYDFLVQKGLMEEGIFTDLIFQFYYWGKTLLYSLVWESLIAVSNHAHYQLSVNFAKRSNTRKAFFLHVLAEFDLVSIANFLLFSLVSSNYR